MKRALVLGSGEGGDYVGGERGQLLRFQRVSVLGVDEGGLFAHLVEAEGTGGLGQIVLPALVVFVKDAIGDGGLEDGLEAIVVFLRDGIELVVVAAGATDRQTEEDRSSGIHHVGALLDEVDVFHFEEHVAVGADAVEAGAGARIGVVRVELIAGDLLFGETVIRFVVVEGFDDVVAVAPGDQ